MKERVWAPPQGQACPSEGGLEGLRVLTLPVAFLFGENTRERWKAPAMWTLELSARSTISHQT